MTSVPIVETTVRTKQRYFWCDFGWSNDMWLYPPDKSLFRSGYKSLWTQNQLKIVLIDPGDGFILPSIGYSPFKRLMGQENHSVVVHLTYNNYLPILLRAKYPCGINAHYQFHKDTFLLKEFEKKLHQSWLLISQFVSCRSDLGKYQLGCGALHWVLWNS